MRSHTSRNAPTWAGLMPFRVTSPRVMAAAMANVPASSRSPMTRCSAPPRRSTPCTSIRRSAVRWICAPIAHSIAMRSSTSGSSAALSMTVVPRARVAAIIAFSVPMTVTVGNSMRAPRRPSGGADAK